MKPSPQYLTPSKAAQFLGVSRRSIYQWMTKGVLPYKVTPGGHRMILVTDLLKDPEEERVA